MKDTSFIARRYLFSKKHISLISTLTMISITGVTIGTALLIVVLSVFNGFYDVIKGLLLSNDPDIRIVAADGDPFLYSREVMDELEGIPEISVMSPYVEGKALISYQRRNDRVINVKGVIPERLPEMNNLQENITAGTFDLSVRNQMPGIVMPRRLLTEFIADVGDPVILLSAEGMRKSLTQFSLPRIYRFRITGSYSIRKVLGEPSAFIDLKAAQRLFNFRNTISGIDLRLTDSDIATEIKTRLNSSLGEKFKISTWYDLQKPLYDVMKIEKWGSYLILMIIVLVAVLNIVGSLTMIVIQKNRDIGVLLTLGHTPKAIKKIFIKQGLYIGFIGCGLGGSIGLLLSWLQKEYGLLKLSSAFIIEAYPASISILDVSIVLLGSLLLCILASWYPAKRAANVDPADAVRYE